MRRRFHPLQEFLKRESSSGILLMLSAALGLGIANSPLSQNYFDILSSGFEVGGGIFYLKLTTLKVVNYILMSIFFFVVGLEIKREMTSGHLASFRDSVMPFLGALGGMALPAGIYLLIAGENYAHGWGVPVATDIALAVGLLGILGSAVTPALRTFLLGLAVIDDIGAILIIAFIYSTGVGLPWVASAGFVIIIITAVKRIGCRNFYIYVILGFALWYFIYRSGIHATLAGVILGLMTPNISSADSAVEADNEGSLSIIELLESKLHPWSSFLIVPLFAFVNTGVVITSESIKLAIVSPIAWGVFFGLVLGKPLGILSAVIIGKRFNVGDYPGSADKSGLLATGSAAGIGFTVAIFISDLAFQNRADQEIAVLAVIVASIVSGLLSTILFSFVAKKSPFKD